MPVASKCPCSRAEKGQGLSKGLTPAPHHPLPHAPSPPMGRGFFVGVEGCHTQQCSQGTLRDAGDLTWISRVQVNNPIYSYCAMALTQGRGFFCGAV